MTFVDRGNCFGHEINYTNLDPNNRSSVWVDVPIKSKESSVVIRVS